MNGRTHAVWGVATTFSTSLLLLHFEPEVSRRLPDFMLPLFEPPNWFFSIPLPLDLGSTPSFSGLGVGGWQFQEMLNQAVSFILAVIVPLLILFNIGFIGGQLPDIDAPNSKIANSGTNLGELVVGGRFGLLGGLVRAVFWLLNLIPQALSLLSNRFLGGHRNGIVHGPLGLFTSSFLVGGVSLFLWGQPFYGLLFFVAFLSHLMLDSLTEMGILWFWPFSKQRYHFLPTSFRLQSDSPAFNLALQLVAIILVVILVFILEGRFFFLGQRFTP